MIVTRGRGITQKSLALHRTIVISLSSCSWVNFCVVVFALAADHLPRPGGAVDHAHYETVVNERKLVVD